jgi:serine/threonine protein kinase
MMLPVTMQHFELRGVVASGGMGTVYHSYDLVLQRIVAIKLMKPELSESPDELEGFYREARACASLNHTNIIHVYHFGEYDGRMFLVMELADNGSMDSRIDTNGRMEELEVLDAGIAMAGALDAALKHNLTHQDIKPGNILYNRENEPKLIDFGLARSAESSEEDADELMGTPYYVAPERIRREPVSWSSDLYSLGATLYHALTGHVPFEAPTANDVVAAHVHTEPTPPNHVVPDIMEATSDAILTTLAKDPRDRFHSYDDFRMALEAARSHLLIQRYNNPTDE